MTITTIMTGRQTSKLAIDQTSSNSIKHCWSNVLFKRLATCPHPAMLLMSEAARTAAAAVRAARPVGRAAIGADATPRTGVAAQSAQILAVASEAMPKLGASAHAAIVAGTVAGRHVVVGIVTLGKKALTVGNAPVAGAPAHPVLAEHHKLIRR